RMVPSLEELIPIAFYHHEHFNGKGYPYGLKKENIPLGARILCICDAFDAMTSNRPYRPPLSPWIACKKIKALSGKQFDPEIVKYAIPILKSLGV
ncbi:MAG: HD domain-containing protein, partial [Candidatus Omnitrophica bacterium]|nr:HD domain-containing protein [Candidatus Omnitrophota bacterium]